VEARELGKRDPDGATKGCTVVFGEVSRHTMSAVMPAPAERRAPDSRKEPAMLKEFKAFMMRGNVLDLAVAVIIGAAFGGILSSAVNDVFMPPIGLLLGNVDF